MAWIGAAFFVFFAWNPRIEKYSGIGKRGGGGYHYRPIFDTSLTAMLGRTSSTVVLMGLAIYTLRDKKGKDES